MIVADHEWMIPVDIETDDGVWDALITDLFDASGMRTWQPARAAWAVGLYLSGPRAGETLIIDDISPDEIKIYSH